MPCVLIKVRSDKTLVYEFPMAGLDHAGVRLNETEPEIQIVIPQTIATPFTSLGGTDGERHLPLYEFEFLKDSQVLGGHLYGESYALGDFVEFGTARGDGAEEAGIDPGIAEFHPQEKPGLLVEIPLHLEHFSPEVRLQRSFWRKAEHISRHPPQDPVNDQPLSRGIAGKEKAGLPEIKGTKPDVSRPPAVKRRSLPQDLPLHKAQEGAAEYEEDPASLPSEVPEPLDHRGEFRGGLTEIGELVEDHEEALLSSLLSQVGEHRFPFGEGQGVQERIGECLPHDFGELTQMLLTGHLAGEKVKSLFLTSPGELKKEFSFSHPPAAIDHEQFGTAGAPSFFQFRQLPLSSDESSFHDEFYPKVLYSRVEFSRARRN